MNRCWNCGKPLDINQYSIVALFCDMKCQKEYQAQSRENKKEIVKTVHGIKERD